MIPHSDPPRWCPHVRADPPTPGGRLGPSQTSRRHGGSAPPRMPPRAPESVHGMCEDRPQHAHPSPQGVGRQHGHCAQRVDALMKCRRLRGGRSRSHELSGSMKGGRRGPPRQTVIFGLILSGDLICRVCGRRGSVERRGRRRGEDGVNSSRD